MKPAHATSATELGRLGVSTTERKNLNVHAGQVLWLTGLSGSGKTTLAHALEMELHRRGLHSFVLDGDKIRQGLNRDLGFSLADRSENIRRIAEVARLMADAGLVVITAFISPFRRERRMARELIGSQRFFEIHVNAPLDVCEQRDPKGLYQRARAGSLADMTGIDSPYEPPEHPDFVAHSAQRTPADIVAELLELLESRTSAAANATNATDRG